MPRSNLQANGRGIYKCAVDSSSGSFAECELIAECANPSYLIRSHDRASIYAVSELSRRQGASIVSYAVSGASIHEIGRQPVEGDLPCHISLHPDGNWIASAQFGDGSIALFPIDEGGAVSEAVYCRTPERVDASLHNDGNSHAHFVAFMRGGRQLSVVDLGKDLISFLEFEAVSPREVSLNIIQELAVHQGSGPRHFATTPDESKIILLAERDESIAMLAERQRTWTEEWRFQPLINTQSGEGAASAIRISPDGRHFYASFRRQSRLVGFETESPGLPKSIADCPTGGEFPRDFAFTPDGKCLVVANQRSNKIASALRSTETGELTLTPFSADVGSPACICL